MKKILILVLVLVILLVGGFFYFITQKQEDFSNSTQYTNPKYTLRLLPGYEARVYSLEGERDIVIQPDVRGNYPSFHIEYFSAEGASFNAIKTGLKNGGYITKKEEEKKIDGVKAFVIDGILDKKIVEGVAEPGKIFATHVLFEYGGNIFRIYLHAENEKDYRDLLSMLETLDLK